LQPLPLAFFGLKPIGDHAGSTRLQDCNKGRECIYNSHGIF
jgi:hypothetical protein